ncbi:hypothetical protein GCM10023340_36530 [Nocardioides marinquilinus]|uniref:Uncharacterized protein n=1 Tax=Nocardioides marinquilinus TaxID=1210400 RepID=A0ABP9Q2U1_9ACTN
MTRHLRIKIESASCALATGYGARDLIEEVCKKAPVRAVLSKGWVVHPRRIPDLVAVAEQRNWDITVTGETPAVTWPAVGQEGRPHQDGGLPEPRARDRQLRAGSSLDTLLW